MPQTLCLNFLVVHSVLNRSRALSNANAFPKTLNGLLSSYQLLDSWRPHHVGAREYTFYTHPHDSYSRLDYIYCTLVLLANSTLASFLPCPWSDHHMVTFALSHVGLSLATAGWRLNDSLLTDSELVDKISAHLKEYFQLNETEDIPTTPLWAVHKAVIGSHIIALVTEKKRSKAADVARLTKDLDKLYHLHSQNHSPNCLRQINQKRLALETILSEQTERLYNGRRLDSYCIATQPRPCLQESSVSLFNPHTHINLEILWGTLCLTPQKCSRSSPIYIRTSSLHPLPCLVPHLNPGLRPSLS